ncbi:S41 family peptidase [Paucisalibacillus globulus]|uniref:S41 family peptidase n=1 Tax=Paucisalibacillus globulus TaxID=351095 RepID=UPI000BB84329|nr:S41 family peptidase [Paucisalibacillus globulus]
MYTNIFREIVDIMHHDYAGYIDKRGWDNPEEFEKKIVDLESNGELTANRFTEIVQDYILDFKDPHILFNLIESETQKEFDNGFRVRRYEDKLYITKLSSETRVEIGEAIISLDQISIPQLVEKHQRELMETKAEREDWRSIISKYNVAEIIDSSGNIRLLELKQYEKSPYQPVHSMKKLNEDTLFMTLSDFFEPTPIDNLIDEHKEELESINNLIIDVRTNNGGRDLSFMNLTKYIFPAGTNRIDSSFYNMKFNCTERNADLTIKSINEELEKADNEQYLEGLQQWKEPWVKNRGKGFISFRDETSGSEFEIDGCEYPKIIIILTDNYCGSAGDIFVYLCKQSSKVTVVGRPTMGINDYANLNEIKLNNQFNFLYPTSRLDQLDNRDPNHEQGIKPHIYIPWTPEHLEKDIDMEKALSLLHESIK